MLCADTRTSGEGNAVGMCSPRGLVISALPRMEIMCSAISFCWSTLQWFSRDRITGYSDVCGGTWEDSLTLVSKMFAMPRRARRTPTTTTHGRECYFRHSSHRMLSDEQSSTDSTTSNPGRRSPWQQMLWRQYKHWVYRMERNHAGAEWIQMKANMHCTRCVHTDVTILTAATTNRPCCKAKRGCIGV